MKLPLTPPVAYLRLVRPYVAARWFFDWNAHYLVILSRIRSALEKFEVFHSDKNVVEVRGARGVFIPSPVLPNMLTSGQSR